ncbi:MFS transporter [Streptomyces cocklensis]|uniref:Inner membrane transport protein YdhP n=1 Tax=Actinacidiphila cocklensis TaxID=887465 RepID=A0A9W4GPZ5_9ACTN|nr:MFS transporter [Actinacidiphila cocklensis]MDD1057997.1 MFS transporter [Actinacidiphila cocklensis]CAG6393015.1 Inner membrane transport protein YdhP [Actinacidiphila cocklensis]
MPLALLALAIGAFGIGTTEFVIVGLLPEIAADYGVSIPSAGLLVTGYALGVVVGAPLMTALGTKMSRKRILMLLMGLFVAGNLISATAPTFGVMLAGRIVASLAHGAFFGIGSVVAADLVAPQKKAGAIATMFTGLTVANIVGVPLGTLVGQAVGWRVTFAVVAALGVVGLLGVAKLVPDLPRPEGAHLRRELTAFRNPQVLLAMAMTVLGFGGVFAAITYIAPMMTHVAGYSDGAVTWLLVLFGIGMFLGNLLGGRYADRALMPMLYATLAGLAAVLALFTVTAHNEILAAVTVVLVGGLGFATVPPLQKRVLDHAHGAPTLASAVNIGAFNLGNALAAWLGGLVISAGLGYTAPNWVGALLATAALLLAFWSAALERRDRGRGSVTPDAAARTPVHH